MYHLALNHVPLVVCGPQFEKHCCSPCRSEGLSCSSRQARTKDCVTPQFLLFLHILQNLIRLNLFSHWESARGLMDQTGIATVSMVVNSVCSRIVIALHLKICWNSVMDCSTFLAFLAFTFSMVPTDIPCNCLQSTLVLWVWASVLRVSTHHVTGSHIDHPVLTSVLAVAFLLGRKSLD